ncbi:unnamed protein product [Closterium sp. NIES-53]
MATCKFSIRITVPSRLPLLASHFPALLPLLSLPSLSALASPSSSVKTDGHSTERAQFVQLTIPPRRYTWRSPYADTLSNPCGSAAHLMALLAFLHVCSSQFLPHQEGPLESDLLLTAAAARTSLPEWATNMQQQRQQRQQRQQWRQHEQQEEAVVMGSPPLFHSSSSHSNVISSNANSSYQHRVLQQTGDTSFAEKNQGMVVLQLLSAGAFQYGRFYSPLLIGAPPRMYVALVDTAVSLSWLYCDCIKCPQDSPVIKQRTFYTTLNSTSAVLLNCTSPACLQLPAAGCSALPRNLSRSNSSCDLRYAPAGDLVQDGMLLKVVKAGAASEQAARINFGCGRMDVGYGGSSVDGVLALGSRPYGLLAQLNASLGLARAYSLCFDGGNQRGALLMGDADAPPGMVSTRLRLLPNVSRSFLAVQSMRIGSSAVGNSSDLAALVNGTQGGFTVDTAVLYAGFRRLVFNTMVNMGEEGLLPSHPHRLCGGHSHSAATELHGGMLSAPPPRPWDAFSLSLPSPFTLQHSFCALLSLSFLSPDTPASPSLSFLSPDTPASPSLSFLIPSLLPSMPPPSPPQSSLLPLPVLSCFPHNLPLPSPLPLSLAQGTRPTPTPLVWWYIKTPS